VVEKFGIWDFGIGIWIPSSLRLLIDSILVLRINLKRGLSGLCRMDIPSPLSPRNKFFHSLNFKRAGDSVGTKACIKINPELTEKTYGKVHTSESRKSTGDSAGGEN
jgi:hypothetical protein